MRILLTNDDGHFAEGLQTLRGVLSERWEVVVVAPDREQSASSHALTLHHPLRVDQVENDVWRVDGTPTDCVRLGMLGAIDGERPDFVVSGVNAGSNLGDDITYSGTVAAAMEGTLLGHPSLAVSLFGNTRYDTAAQVTAELVALVQDNGMPPDTLLNVNVPDVGWEELSGIKLTHQGKRTYSEQIVKKRDPSGRPYYWVAGEGPYWETDEGADFSAVEAGYVSVTPLHLDLTNHRAIETMKDWEFGKR